MKSINTQAPIIAYKTIEIDSNIELVWQKLTSIAHWPKWHRGIKRARLEGKLTPGSEIFWKTGGMSIRAELHTVEAPVKFGWTGKSIGLLAIHNFRLFAVNGKTHLLIEESMEGWPAAFFKGMLQVVVEKSLQQWLDELKLACENQTQNCESKPEEFLFI